METVSPQSREAEWAAADAPVSVIFEPLLASDEACPPADRVPVAKFTLRIRRVRTGAAVSP